MHTTIQLDDSERQPCEVWTRVMGYHRPVSQFNRGKKEEHAERKHFVEHPQRASTPCVPSPDLAAEHIHA